MSAAQWFGRRRGARDQAARDQAARDQAARDQAARDQAEGARDEAEARAAAARAAERDEIDEAVGATAGDVNRRQLRERLERQAARRSTDRAADKDRRAHRNRYARKFRDGDGLTLQFHGPAAAAQTIWAMLEALSRTPAAAGTRTGEQRRFDALRDVADRYLREGRLPEVAGHPAQVLLITGHDTLHENAARVHGCARPCSMRVVNADQGAQWPHGPVAAAPDGGWRAGPTTRLSLARRMGPVFHLS